MSHLYCAGCNERFVCASETPVCPRCGALAPSTIVSAIEPTLLYRNDSDHPLSGFDTTQGDPEELIGEEVNVYRCDSLLGCGGMGCVYLAHHLDLHRKCALKILSRKLAANDKNYVDRFQLEGRSSASLNHPNIVTVHAIGETDGRHYLEMEFVAGPSLQQVLDEEGALTPVRATTMVSLLASGLAAAHGHGIVHRDLKPDNVLLTPAGIPKIADFGLAKRIAGRDDLENYIAGTPNFMAPELFHGQQASPASDVYALGVCYFLLLTGKFPFHGRSINELRSDVSSSPVPDVRDSAPATSLEMAEILNQMLAKSPANRPADGTHASQLLQAVLGQVRDIESLLLEAFKETESVRWRRNGRQYEISVDLQNGRKQRTIVEPSDHSANERLLLIYSICCPARMDYFENALRINSNLPHGALALRDIDGTTMFVMVDTYPRATVDSEEIRRSVLEVSERADEVEHALTGQDHN